MHNRLKQMGSAVLIISILVSLTSCSQTVDVNEKIDILSSQFATKARNLDNMGLMVEGESGMFYFDGETHQRKLYRLDFEKEYPTEIIELNGGFLNIVDEMLYYVDYDKDDRIYRIGKEGDNQELICDLWCIDLIEFGGDLYFSAGEEEVQWTGRWEGNCSLYRMDLDGKNLTKLADGVVTNIYPYNGYVYFTDISGSFPQLYRIDSDGENRTLLTNETVDGFFIVGEMIYFSNFTEFYKMSLSGGRAEKIEKISHSTQSIPNTSICVYNQYLIYSTDYYLEEGIHIYNMDTQKDKRISRDFAIVTYVINGKIYYRGESQMNWIFKEIK